MMEHRHYKLLKAIVDTVIEKNLNVYMFKVKSHTNIVGNEIADAIANGVAKGDIKSTLCYNAIPDSNDRKNRYWPYYPDKDHSLETTKETLIPFANIYKQLKSHIVTNTCLGYSNKKSTYFQLWENISPYLEHGSSHWFLSTKKYFHPGMVRTILRCRTGTLWNNKRAQHMNMSETNNCPLCKTNIDGIQHMLGGCLKLKNFYIEGIIGLLKLW